MADTESKYTETISEEEFNELLEDIFDGIESEEENKFIIYKCPKCDRPHQVEPGAEYFECENQDCNYKSEIQWEE